MRDGSQSSQDSREWAGYIHSTKTIAYLQSTFFKAAISFPVGQVGSHPHNKPHLWLLSRHGVNISCVKEAEGSKIDLPEDGPAAVKAIVEFF
jgi:hypothetical protein